MLDRVLRDGAYTQLALSGALERGAPLSAPDRGLATELVYGTLRHLPRLDGWIGKACTRPLKKVDGLVLDAIRLAAYEALVLDHPPHAAVHSWVEVVTIRRGKGAAGFANGVLRGLLRLRESGALAPRDDATPQALEERTGVPRWLLDDVVAQRGFEDAQLWAQGTLNKADVHVCSVGAPDAEGALATAGIAAQPHPWVPDAWVLGTGSVVDLVERTASGAWVMNGASQVVARWAAGASAGNAGPVVDVCAAPGGKSALMCRLGHRVVSGDIHIDKLHLARRQWAALGVHPQAVALDGARMPMAPGSAAVVLLDAPCSGTGLLSRRPEIKLRRTPKDVQSLASLQRRLLDAAAHLVRPGGALLYSVCSITRAEGTAQVAAFVSRHPAFSRGAPPPFVPASAVSALGEVTLWPHLHGVDGFFAALLLKAA